MLFSASGEVTSGRAWSKLVFGDEENLLHVMAWPRAVGAGQTRMQNLVARI